MLTTDHNEGIGAISYVEYARHLFPEPGKSDREINNLTAVMVPGEYLLGVWHGDFRQLNIFISVVVYWLVFFSIIVHGLSVPLLNAIYKFFKVTPVHDDPVEVVLLSENEPLPNNSTAAPQRHSAILNNRFARRDEGDDFEDDDNTHGSMLIDMEHGNDLHNRHLHHHHHYHHLHLHQSLNRRRQSLPLTSSDEFQILHRSDEGRASVEERPTTSGESVRKDNCDYNHIEMRNLI
jgi:hypothetical protein